MESLDLLKSRDHIDALGIFHGDEVVKDTFTDPLASKQEGSNSEPSSSMESLWSMISVDGDPLPTNEYFMENLNQPDNQGDIDPINQPDDIGPEFDESTIDSFTPESDVKKESWGQSLFENISIESSPSQPLIHANDTSVIDDVHQMRQMSPGDLDHSKSNDMRLGHFVEIRPTHLKLHERTLSGSSYGSDDTLPLEAEFSDPGLQVQALSYQFKHQGFNISGFEKANDYHGASYPSGEDVVSHATFMGNGYMGQRYGPKRHRRKQSLSKMPLSELYAHMSLSHDHVEAKAREERIMDIVRTEGFNIGYRTWIRDTEEGMRLRIIDTLYNKTFEEYGYSKRILEAIVRRGTYARMQSRLRKNRRNRRSERL